MKRHVLTLTLLSILTLPGCSKMIRTERIVLAPPKNLLVECQPVPSGKTFLQNRDLVRDRNDWRLAYGVCAANNDGLVAWVRGACKIEGCQYADETSPVAEKCGFWAKIAGRCSNLVK